MSPVPLRQAATTRSIASGASFGPSARTTAETMAHIVHTRVTDTSGFPSYARRGEEAGYALDHASTSNEAPAWTRQAFAGAPTASTARRIRARAICTL